MPIVIAIIVGLILLGLLATYWYVALPLLLIGGAAFGVLARRDRQKVAQQLAALAPAERAQVLLERQRRDAAWQRKAEERRQAVKQRQLARGKATVMPISQVAKRGEGGVGLGCPRCGGTGFKARRSSGARVGITTATVVTGGLGGLAGAAVTKQKQVQCVTCGARYARG